MLNKHVSALKVHCDKESALKCFNSECRRYFELNTDFRAKTLLASYGYPLRKFYGLSARGFKRMMDTSIDDALKLANEGREQK